MTLLVPTVAKRIVKAIVEAIEITPPEERARRTAVCDACPNLKPLGRCGKCRCPIVSRIFSLPAKCPDQPPRW